METMKAVEYYTYGNPEVLQHIEVEKPSPKPNEVLVKIHNTTVTGTESTFRKGNPKMARLFMGLRKPKLNRLGEEIAGTIESIGSEVKEFKVGDEVFGTAGPKFGANAEYLCVPESGVLSLKPKHYNFAESAASVDGFLTALPFLRDIGLIKSGQEVLIYGASGSVGSSAVQVAKAHDTTVTAVCSTSNIELVKSIGADYAIDYKREDFTKNGRTYDIIFDAVGKTDFTTCKKSLKPNGIFLEAGIGMGVLKHVLWTALFGDKKAKITATGLRPEKDRRVDLYLLKEWMEEGKIQPVIDRTYPLSDIVEAHRYVDQGHKKGNVVIDVVS